MRETLRIGPPLALGLIAGLACSASGQVETRVLAVSGEQAPGLDPGITFDFFDMVRTDGSGHVLFQADLAGEGIDDLPDGSIWSDRGGDLSLLVREGDQAPFGNLVLYTSLTSPAFNGDSSMAFGAALDIKGGPEETTVGLFSEDETFFLTPFALDGTVQDEIELRGLTPAPFNDLGQSAYVAAEGAGLWLNTPGEEIVLVASAGEQLDGMPDGTEVKHISRPTLSAGGADLAFHASFSTPDNDGPNLERGLWIGDEFDASALAISGEQAPGYIDGVVFEDFGRVPAINEGAQVGFFAIVDGPGIFPGNDGALWFGDSDEIVTIAREGSQAPGLEPGAEFSALAREFAITKFGLAAFGAHVTGAGVTAESNSGIWAGEIDPGVELELVAREGDVAPGTGGATFASFSTPAMSDSGYVAFTARLRQDEPEFGDNHGLFLATPDGPITLIAMEGDPFEVDGEDRVISDISFDSRADGRASLTDDGEVYFKLYFEDRSQALVMGAEGCYGDFNGDGNLDVVDFVAFQLAWQAMDPVADCDGNGAFDVVDFVCFQQAWQAGCP